MTKKILTVSLVVLFCGGMLFAQRGMYGGGARMEADPAAVPADQLKTFLSLTDQQLQNLKGVQTAFRDAASPIMRQIAEKSRALRDAMQQNDTAKADALKAEIDALRKQEQDLRAQYKVQALDVLNADQKTKLAFLQQALDLMPTAQQAVFLMLLDSPQGFGGGPGFRGGRGPGGPGPEARTRP